VVRGSKTLAVGKVTEGGESLNPERRETIGLNDISFTSRGLSHAFSPSRGGRMRGKMKAGGALTREGETRRGTNDQARNTGETIQRTFDAPKFQKGEPCLGVNRPAAAGDRARSAEVPTAGRS